MISIGIIGCGAVTHRNYAPTLRGRDAYAVRWVHDANEAQAASAAALFGCEPVPLEVLVDRADAVVIATPPSSHAQLIEAALRPGRIILCEKPFMTAFDQADAIVARAASEESRLYIAHWRRTFPQLELARRLIGLGLIGDPVGIRIAEGGRFVWNAVSNYTMRDAAGGGVLWDTGSHTLDMALFASGLDVAPDLRVGGIEVRKDRPEPSHEFRARFTVAVSGRDVPVRLALSRKELLPNAVAVEGTAGKVEFVTEMDDRVRLTTEKGSVVVDAPVSYRYLLECLDVQLRRIFFRDRDDEFAASTFLNQMKILEALAHA